ncbi:MAG: hypothetical protein BJ554DRAFT_4035 [Olpidium bornovanus]|uniref:Uncharacterized protein n=1 Tax=Olpidium bornovanus TaxID=278681 RepID=A0A8H7ZMW2_9FUNG|nr:MAG: hypothetical protein BJ554DRAFT_4035 [Olpidium bornovanus]
MVRAGRRPVDTAPGGGGVSDGPLELRQNVVKANCRVSNDGINRSVEIGKTKRRRNRRRVRSLRSPVGLNSNGTRADDNFTIVDGGKYEAPTDVDVFGAYRTDVDVFDACNIVGTIGKPLSDTPLPDGMVEERRSGEKEDKAGLDLAVVDVAHHPVCINESLERNKELKVTIRALTMLADNGR